ncbi:MAG: glyoxalase [Rhodospirillaceae bacterium]|nr:MAG: glyoxalase [Rhodospirillaceae bacterium]
MNSRPNPFNGLRHIGLRVPNLEDCIDFYINIIGMKVLRRASDDLIYLTLGNDNLSLGRAAKGASVGDGGWVDHFGFIVDSKDDLEDWYHFMKAQGVDVLDAPHDHSDGARSFHCKDPAGNIVQPLYHAALSGQTFSEGKSP